MKNSTDIHRESEIAPTRWPLVVAKKKKKTNKPEPHRARGWLSPSDPLTLALLLVPE
jgi:hypothetical protein